MGDPGHDWLDMNLSRSRDPELRPSTNTSVGRVIVLDEKEQLIQKTDRIGFVENTPFTELKEFCIAALDWMQHKRLAVREEQREKKKVVTDQRIVLAEENLSKAINNLPMADRREISQATRELSLARSSELVQVRGRIGAVSGPLASVGTTVSVFAHEIEGPATDLTASAKAVERRASKALGVEYERTLSSQIGAVRRSSELLARFATLPLGLLRKSKRRRIILDVNDAVNEALTLFEPYLLDAHIEIVREFSAEPGQVRCSISAIESVLSNLITNSVKAFQARRGPYS